MKTPLTIMIILIATYTAHAQTRMSLQVREGRLRTQPSYLGTVTAAVEYGEQVNVLKAQGPWRYVSASDQRSGWIHESAITRRKIELAAGAEDASGAATREEMSLAGKGFSAEVEGEFRARHHNIDFTWVDYMETLAITPERLAHFLKEGNVAPTEGGR